MILATLARIVIIPVSCIKFRISQVHENYYYYDKWDIRYSSLEYFFYLKVAFYITLFGKVVMLSSSKTTCMYTL